MDCCTGCIVIIRYIAYNRVYRVYCIAYIAVYCTIKMMPLILYNIALLHYSAAAASDTHLRDPREALAALGEEELRHGVAAAVGQGDRATPSCVGAEMLSVEKA